MTTSRPTLACGERQLALGSRTFVMGVVNVTPDSFSDGGRSCTTEAAVAHALSLLDDGADVVDVGGESTRPGAKPVTTAEELSRVQPVVEALVASGVRCLSVDTRNAATAKACLEAGASWLNDVSALRHDDGMAEVARGFDVVVLMHARGEPETMQRGVIEYDDVVEDVARFLEERVAFAVSRGLSREQLLVDPGLGFGKRLPHNLALTRGLSRLSDVGAGVLYGPSRKRFLGELTGVSVAAERDRATVGAVCYGATVGADVVRVHDVKGCVEALRVVDALVRA